MLAPRSRSPSDGHEPDGPIARLVALAGSYELTLASLHQQIALAKGEEPSCDLTEKTREAAVRMVAMRKQLRQLCGHDLMQDAAFDIALEILSIQIRGHRMGVMDVCAGLDFPDSTTRRWLQRLEVAGLVERLEDPDDHRRAWVSLTPAIFGSLRIMLQSFA